MSNIFITGSTGFIGSSLVLEILKSSPDTVHALIRGETPKFAKNRLVSKLNKLAGGLLSDEFLSRIFVYNGDVCADNFGLEKRLIRSLAEKIDAVFHVAAITDLNRPLEEIWKTNVTGTKNILDFCVLCKEGGRLKKVNHISTAFVAGKAKGVFTENDLDVGQVFNNTYEKTKFEAEKVVNEYRLKGLDIDVFRPSIVLGRHSDGLTTSFKMFYQPLHFLSLELIDKFPYQPGLNIYIVNNDIAIKSILMIYRAGGEINENYLIDSPVRTNIKTLIEYAGKYFGFKIPEFVSQKKKNIFNEFTPVVQKILSLYLPYFGCGSYLTMHNTLRIARKEAFDFPEFDNVNMNRLFEYCSDVGFVKKKDIYNAVR